MNQFFADTSLPLTAFNNNGTTEIDERVLPYWHIDFGTFTLSYPMQTQNSFQYLKPCSARPALHDDGGIARSSSVTPPTVADRHWAARQWRVG